MENLYQTGLQIVLWFQSLGSWLNPIMKFFTFLGSTQFFLLVAPALLWCIDATLGIRLGIFLMINASVNAALKVAFHGPRPYWYSSEVKVFGGAETSFGAPSGHAQNAVVVWGTLADRIKSRVAWIIAIVIMFMIGISRIFLALHFPHDVLLGWLFGAIMLWALLRFEKPVLGWLKKYSSGIQIFLVFLFSLFLVLLFVIMRLTLNGWTVPVEWITNAHQAFPDEPAINPLSFENVLVSTGSLFGLAAGWIWLTRQGGLLTHATWYKLVLRYIVGIIGVLILYVGLGYLFPQTETITAYVLQYIQFSLIGFWMAGIAPWLFVKLNLASHLA